MKKSILVCLAFLVQACTVTVVQPYDEKLVSATEAFYKETALGLEKAREISPNNRNLPDGSTASDSLGHLSKHINFYSNAKIGANSLIIRAMINTEKVDKIATDVHKQIEKLISQSLPSNCSNDKAQVTGTVTLTLQNYLDLKCLITYWEVQHSTATHQILKKTNWESRQLSLMGMIVSIQKAESFKTKVTVN
ncbi:hypothetical protein AMS58_19370 [Pseudoalteromonas porphyrae]|uniref:hypothetical protein n=1 Tax=Pseudoalteromonas porphyrae TaxID=187330 RepID=UPI0006BA7E04|nr:hypothetical protein [Pseudoalteromonas porphyrae]KPH93088.1 hypothetical protein AMS58_19370 [Pseudoalteromonas porphyrae]